MSYYCHPTVLCIGHSVMSSSRSASVEVEHTNTAVSEVTAVKSDGDLVLQLFEDDSLEVDESAAAEEEGEDVGEDDMKEEDSITAVAEPSSSRSASADAKPSPSPDDDGDQSPTPRRTEPKPKAKKVKFEPQLIGDLPRAEEAAMKTFVEIRDNHYQYGTLGRSREALESMTCDCQYEHGQYSFNFFFSRSIRRRHNILTPAPRWVVGMLQVLMNPRTHAGTTPTASTASHRSSACLTTVNAVPTAKINGSFVP